MTWKNIGVFMMVVAAPSVFATNMVLQSFSTAGRITFSKITNAAYYRVEWASSPTNVWQDFSQAAARLDHISSAGSGAITASVPMAYRVVGHPAPANMALIPAGTFVMGNPTNFEGSNDEVPQHPVTVRPFFADTRFPWTDFTNMISHAKANYSGNSANFPYDLSAGYHPDYGDDATGFRCARRL